MLDEIKVLDQGFVRLVDVMGDDSSIVQAARVSYGKGTKSVNEDEGLIRYLLRHRHTTPFEMVEFKFHCRMPIFVARQWIRHRTANVNEVSARYSEMPDMFYCPDEEVCTTQSAQNKQGGTGDPVSDPKRARLLIDELNKKSFGDYKELLEMGMRRELARVTLPVSLYTEWYWKIDLHNLMHFLKLRMDQHAQYEIRVFGEAMAELVKTRVPISWKAFEDYHLNSQLMTSGDLALLKILIEDGREVMVEKMTTIIPNKRELLEFKEKLCKFGIVLD